MSRVWRWIGIITLGLTWLATARPPYGLIGLVTWILIAGTVEALMRPKDWHVCNREGAPFIAIDGSGNASRSYPTCSVCRKPQTS